MSTPKDPRTLACVLCWRRKLKCDHETPCSNCFKAKVTCTPRTPAPARRRRRVIKQDLKQRLAQLEALLKQHTGAISPPTRLSIHAPDLEEQQSHSSSFHSTPESLRPRSPVHMSEIGRMLKDNAGIRFVDSYTLAAILENLSELRAMIETESPSEDENPRRKDVRPEIESESLLDGAEVTSSHVDELQPEPSLGIRLWHIYLERVNPLLKITHIPTLQPHVMEAAGSIQKVHLKYQALLFAIYIMSAVSLSHAEVHHMIGMPREEAIRRFTRGLKMVLVQLDFVKNCDMVLLQALVLYTTSLQGQYDRHAAWVLSGTVLRIAQKMGYHRDGEALNLPPFETEMRRRIWWQIIGNDVKYALFSGLNRSLFPVHWDTKRPSNLNDADLYPGLTEPAQDRDGPTEMAYVLIVTEITKAMSKIATKPGFDAALMGRSMEYAKGNKTQEATNLEEYRAIVRDLEANFQKIERRFVDQSAGKVHEAALIIRPLIIIKALELLGTGEPSVYTPQDRLIRALVSNLEDTASCQMSMAKHGFGWAAQIHFNVEVMTVLTVLLAERPDTPIANRAWNSIEVCHRELFKLEDTTPEAYYEQAILTLRAWQTRVGSELGDVSEGLGQEPDFITHLKATVDSYDSQNNVHPSSSTNHAPNVTNPPSQVTELDALLSGYFDVSQFQQRDTSFTAASITPALHANSGPELMASRHLRQSPWQTPMTNSSPAPLILAPNPTISSSTQASDLVMLNMSSGEVSQWQQFPPAGHENPSTQADFLVSEHGQDWTPMM